MTVFTTSVDGHLRVEIYRKPLSDRESVSQDLEIDRTRRICNTPLIPHVFLLGNAVVHALDEIYAGPGNVFNEFRISLSFAPQELEVVRQDLVCNIDLELLERFEGFQKPSLRSDKL